MRFATPDLQTSISGNSSSVGIGYKKWAHYSYKIEDEVESSCGMTSRAAGRGKERNKKGQSAKKFKDL